MKTKYKRPIFHFSKSKIATKIFLSAILLSANVQAETVSCPSIDIIQNAAFKLNIATKKSNDTYNVYTEDYVFEKNKIYWRVGANDIITSSVEDALTLGRAMIKQIRFRDSDIALEINPIEYKCTYAPQHVYALGFKQ